MSESAATALDRLHAVREAQKPLRVAIFSGNYNYVMDGPVRALNKLVGHLEKRGHKVIIFAPTTKTPALQHEGELISIRSVPLPGRRSEYRFGLGLRGEALRRLEEFQPNLVHISAPDYTGFMALKWAEKNAVTPVASFHTRFDTYPRYYGARWLEKYVTNYMRDFYSRCAHVYAPSQSMADELAEEGIGKDVRLWARGVDSKLFNPVNRDRTWRRTHGLREDDVVVAYVGRVVLEKGIDIFAETILSAAAKNPKIKALVVGDGPERTRFEEKLPGGVFVGYQHGEDLARAYASADVFFNPSITETFGQVTLEAMASGLPCLCAAAAGSRSLVDEGGTGYLLPVDSGADAYAEKLLVLAGDADLRRRMGEAAHEKSRAYNWDVILDGLVADYREAMMNKS